MKRVTDLKDIRGPGRRRTRRTPNRVFVPRSRRSLCRRPRARRHGWSDPRLVVGLATSLGGPTSHTAIIARSSEFPVVAVSGSMTYPPAPKSSLTECGETIAVSPDPAEAAAAVGAAAAAAVAAEGGAARA